MAGARGGVAAPGARGAMIGRREVWREPGGRAPWWFLAPVLAFTGIFLALPLAFSVWLAFTR